MLSSALFSALSVSTDTPLGMNTSLYPYKVACKISDYSTRDISSTNPSNIAMPQIFMERLAGPVTLHRYYSSGSTYSEAALRVITLRAEAFERKQWELCELLLYELKLLKEAVGATSYYSTS